MGRLALVGELSTLDMAAMILPHRDAMTRATSTAASTRPLGRVRIRLSREASSIYFPLQVHDATREVGVIPVFIGRASLKL